MNNSKRLDGKKVKVKMSEQMNTMHVLTNTSLNFYTYIGYTYIGYTGSSIKS